MDLGKTTAPEKERDSPRQARLTQSHRKLCFSGITQTRPNLHSVGKNKGLLRPKAFGISPYLRYNHMITNITRLTTIYFLHFV